MNDDREFQALRARVRNQAAPEVDVIESVMVSVRRAELSMARSRRVLSVEAAAAFVVVVLVSVAAMDSVSALLDPMLSLFGGFEVAFR